MLVKNIGYTSLEWLINHGVVKSISRSKDSYYPSDLEDTYFAKKGWTDLSELIFSSSELLESKEIANYCKGYDVEISYLDDNFPEEIKNRLA